MFIIGKRQQPCVWLFCRMDGNLSVGETVAEKPRPKAEWQTNDPVRVTTGPFANFQGVISEVDDERQKVKVLVNIFGRETPVELSYDQISKV